VGLGFSIHKPFFRILPEEVSPRSLTVVGISGYSQGLDDYSFGGRDWMLLEDLSDNGKVQNWNWVTSKFQIWG